MELEYQLIRSRKRKKTLSLKITGTGTVVIQAPYHTPVGEIASFFERKKDWIREKIKQINEFPAVDSPSPLAPGKPFLFLGKPYSLEIDDHGSQVELFTLRDEQFILNGRIRRHGKDIIRAWYEAQARAYLPARVEYYSRLWELKAAGLRISNAGSRWGSCSHRDVLSFTWRLMMAPPPVIDYVVIHELAHIREKNHAHSFWTLVSRIMPDYEIHKHWLRKNGYRLCL